jgi:hypothetical protein
MVTVAAPAGATTVSGVTVSSASAAAGPFNAGAGNTIALTGAKCAPAITAGIDRTTGYYGDAAVVTGQLTRTLLGGGTAPVAGAKLSVTRTVGTSVATIGTATTNATGSFTATIKPSTDAVAVRVVLANSVSYQGTAFDVGTTSVALPATRLTAASSASTIGYGQPLTVSGTLARDAGGAVTPIASATVTVTVTAPTEGAKPVTIGTGRTTATGTFAVTVPARAGGALAVRYAGVIGQPAAGQALGALTVQSWSTALTFSAPGTVRTGVAVAASGTLMRALPGGPTVAAASIPVKVYLRPAAGGSQVLLASATTKADGTFTAKILPKVNGTVVAVVASVAGHADATSAPITVTVVPA